MRKLVTIIIPTYKRREVVVRLLESLIPEMKKTYEVIIVEQGENNQKFFNTFSIKRGLPIHYFFLKKANISKARNTGVENSNGTILIFLDDDTIVTPGFIKAHVKNYNDPRIGAVCGRVITPNQPIETVRMDTGKVTFFGKFTDGFSSTIRQEIDAFIGCNCSWRRAVFTEIGGYDERFIGAMREDSDVSLRTKKAGYQTVFDPDALVYHVRAESGGTRKTEGRIHWYFNYFSNEIYFFLKYRPIWAVPIIMLSRWEWILRCMFGFEREVSFRSVSTPFLGMLDGIKKYQKWKYIDKHVLKKRIS